MVTTADILAAPHFGILQNGMQAKCSPVETACDQATHASRQEATAPRIALVYVMLYKTILRDQSYCGFVNSRRVEVYV